MKKNTCLAITLACIAFSGKAQSADLMVAATMQRCAVTEECTLVSNNCTDNCGFIPVNKSSLPVLEQSYQARCNKPSSSNPPCTMNPPMAAACINGRCTIDYAYINNGDKNDYKSGAFGVPPAAVPSQVKGDYSRVNDRKGGFSAYDLPQKDVREGTIGELHTTIYTPPSAPVSGGNYVPVGSQPQPQQVPASPASIAMPVPAPAPQAPALAPVQPEIRAVTKAQEPSLVITPTAPQAAAPVLAPVPAVNAHIAPAAAPPPPSNVPVMTPSRPYKQAAPQTPSGPIEYVAPETNAAPAAVAPIPSVGAAGIPRAPSGSIPIPPSDLKPAPTFVPPPGTAIPVGPNDPGAPPSAGTFIQLSPSDAVVPPVEGSKRPFNNTATPKKYMGSANLNQ